MPYRCHTCGQDHDDLPDLGCAHPDSWLLATDEERAAGQWTSGLCTIGGHCFIRGMIEIPLRDYERPFGGEAMTAPALPAVTDAVPAYAHVETDGRCTVGSRPDAEFTLTLPGG